MFANARVAVHVPGNNVKSARIAAASMRQAVMQRVPASICRAERRLPAASGVAAGEADPHAVGTEARVTMPPRWVEQTRRCGRARRVKAVRARSHGYGWREGGIACTRHDKKHRRVDSTQIHATAREAGLFDPLLKRSGAI